jgi:hypothetical protein
LLFWQNGLFGLYGRNDIVERLKHVLDGYDSDWLTEFEIFSTKFKFDTFWFGNSESHNAFRCRGAVPILASCQIDITQRAFPRCPRIPCHAYVAWNLSSLSEGDNDVVIPHQMLAMNRRFPGPGHVRSQVVSL